MSHRGLGSTPASCPSRRALAFGSPSRWVRAGAPIRRAGRWGTGQAPPRTRRPRRAGWHCRASRAPAGAEQLGEGVVGQSLARAGIQGAVGVQLGRVEPRCGLDVEVLALAAPVAGDGVVGAGPVPVAGVPETPQGERGLTGRVVVIGARRRRVHEDLLRVRRAAAGDVRAALRRWCGGLRRLTWSALRASAAARAGPPAPSARA